MAKSRRSSSPSPPVPSHQPWPAGRWLRVVGLALGIGLAGWWWQRQPTEFRTELPGAKPERVAAADDPSVFAHYAGSASCQECHEEAFQAWRTSNHALAERSVQTALDRPAFDPPRTFSHGTQTTALEWTNGLAQVVCLGLTGPAESHTVARVIGHEPLRQFLVPFPGGRFQTLEASFDPRSNQWFNVYGNEDRKPGEWGHWTGRGMNWNFMCAGCHNTRLRRNYDAATDSYHTAMAEMSVGCEACHGPLQPHVEWQRQFGRSGRPDPTVVKASRDQTFDTCGFCHARRTELTGDFLAGDRFLDHFELTLPDESDRYYADGQVRDENYECGSFLGSRMHLRGVRCADCHEPHSAKTRLPGNWLCLRCHNGGDPNAPVINPVAHSFHKVHGFDTNGLAVDTDLMSYQPKQIKETGGECVNCHMPQTVYMQRHWRHDHGFTSPDPWLTKAHGIPNACNRCHQDQTVDWALAHCEQWYGDKLRRPARERAVGIMRARQGDPAASQGLIDLFRREESPYWQASLLGLLAPWAVRPEVSAVLLDGLNHTNALVRAAAGHALELAVRQPGVPSALQTRLNDPSRNVRLAAAWSLRASLDPASPAGRELARWLELGADQPGGQLRQGDYWLARDDPQSALPFFRRAAAWDGHSPLFHQRVATALSLLGRPREAVEALENGCRLNPEDAESRYQLGLARNEAGQLEQARLELERATRLDPRHASAWYNLGLAQNALGQPEEAVTSLLRSESVDLHQARAPYARATIQARLGQSAEAIAAVRRALEVEPSHPEARELLRHLQEGAGH